MIEGFGRGLEPETFEPGTDEGCGQSILAGLSETASHLVRRDEEEVGTKLIGADRVVPGRGHLRDDGLGVNENDSG